VSTERDEAQPVESRPLPEHSAQFQNPPMWIQLTPEYSELPTNIKNRAFRHIGFYGEIWLKASRLIPQAF